MNITKHDRLSMYNHYQYSKCIYTDDPRPRPPPMKAPALNKQPLESFFFVNEGTYRSLKEGSAMISSMEGIPPPDCALFIYKNVKNADYIHKATLYQACHCRILH